MTWGAGGYLTPRSSESPYKTAVKVKICDLGRAYIKASFSPLTHLNDHRCPSLQKHIQEFDLFLFRWHLGSLAKAFEGPP